MHWVVVGILFVAIGAPTAALMLDRIRDYPAPKFFKTQGLFALVVFLAITIYALVTGSPLLQLIIWGIVGGLVATIALDIVRLIGVRLEQFPMDMPRMFGAMTLGVAPVLPKHVMAKLVVLAADLHENERKEMLRPRILAISRLPKDERLGFVSMMYNGLNKLAPEKRQAFLATQIALLSELTSENRQAMLAAMDYVMRESSHKPMSVTPFSPSGAFRRGLMPKIPMEIFRHLVNPAMSEAAAEKQVSIRKIIVAGYLWHFINGATYSLAYTLLFGAGSWPLAIAWGIFVWLVMMIGMPNMMPMIKLPYPRFTIVPFIAHIAMAIPIGYFALTFITPEASAFSLLAALVEALSR